MAEEQQKIQELTTEERILEAAKKVFLRDGLHGSRMETIAKEAEVTKASLHYYFRTKEKLFDAIFQEVKGNMLPRVAGIFNSDLNVFEKIQYFIESYIDLIAENPYLPLFLINEVNKDPEKFFEATKISDRVQLFLPAFIQELLTEIENGNIKPIHPFQLILNVMSMCAFPFVAKPMLQKIGGFTEEQFQALIQERKKVVVEFVFNAIKA